MRAWLVMTAAIALSSCSIDFDSPSEVTDLRTLAIQAEPPELLVSADGNTPRVALRALVVDPRAPAREVDVTWQACGATTDHRCVEAPFVLEISREPAVLPILETDMPVTRELLQSAQSLDTLQGFGGLPIVVELQVDAGDGGHEVGIKQVVAQAFFPPGFGPNRNPSPPQLRRDDAVWPEDEIPVVAPKTEVAVEPVAPEGDAEHYAVFRFDTQVQELDEHLAFRFFATAGTWNRDETGGPPNGISTETTLASRWTAPDDPPEDGAPIHVWVVVRDGRGGIAWTTRDISVE